MDSESCWRLTAKFAVPDTPVQQNRKEDPRGPRKKMRSLIHQFMSSYSIRLPISRFRPQELSSHLKITRSIPDVGFRSLTLLFAAQSLVEIDKANNPRPSGHFL
ncbi:hypothetical protein ABZP36_034762 [Zizania latifolia]